MTKECMVLKRTNKTLTPRSCSSLGTQLPGTPFVIKLKWFRFTKWSFKTGQDNRNSSLGLVKGDRNRLISAN